MGKKQDRKAARRAHDAEAAAGAATAVAEGPPIRRRPTRPRRRRS